MVMHCMPMSQSTRVIDAGESELIARRMLATLVEVLAPERGRAQHTLEEARERVRSHLVQERSVVVSELAGEVVGHKLLRVEDDERGGTTGLFGTIYVAPAHRRQGIASQLIHFGETWFVKRGKERATTYSDRDNTPRLGLFRRHSFEQRLMPRDFVAFSRRIGAE